jgi:hypothetical protein
VRLSLYMMVGKKIELWPASCLINAKGGPAPILHHDPDILIVTDSRYLGLATTQIILYKVSQEQKG